MLPPGRLFSGQGRAYCQCQARAISACLLRRGRYLSSRRQATSNAALPTAWPDAWPRPSPRQAEPVSSHRAPQQRWCNLLPAPLHSPIWRQCCCAFLPPDITVANCVLCTHLQPRTELWLARIFQVPDTELPLASSRGQQVGAQVAELQAIHLQHRMHVNMTAWGAGRVVAVATITKPPKKTICRGTGDRLGVKMEVQIRQARLRPYHLQSAGAANTCHVLCQQKSYGLQAWQHGMLPGKNSSLPISMQLNSRHMCAEHHKIC